MVRTLRRSIHTAGLSGNTHFHSGRHKKLVYSPGRSRSFLHSDDHLRFRILRRFGFSARHILQVVFDAVHRKSVQSRKFLFLRRRISLGIGICVYKILEHGSKRYSPQKKMFLTVSSMLAAATLTAVLLPQYRYLTIFFSMPFAVVTTEFFAGSGGGKGIIRWYLIILAGFSLFFFK